MIVSAKNRFGVRLALFFFSGRLCVMIMVTVTFEFLIKIKVIIGLE